MAADYQRFLLRLTENLNILRQREAKYGGAAPLDLLNQMADHEQAIALTEQAGAGDLSEAAWNEALRPLLIAIEARADHEPDCRVTIGDMGRDIVNSIIAGRDVNLHIHPASDRAQRAIPWQRPTRAVHFTNRKEELARLLADLQPGRVVTLCGPGGVGKSALAAEAVWQLPAERFPDGMIFHSFYNQPQAALALEQIALSFGEEPRPSPRDAARRALSRRCALLFLDGAEDADDLPAVLDVAGGGCGVIVTSRKRADARAERQDVHPLDMAEAVKLLQAWGQAEAADDEAAGQLCQQVGGLPLAVRLLGKYLDETGESAAETLAWLARTPLAALDRGRHRHDSVPLLLDRSLAQVSETARRVLGVVGLLALAPFAREPLAAALGLDEAHLRPPLGELVSYGLLARHTLPPSSFLLHPYEVSHALIHTYARERVEVTAETFGRLVIYYETWATEQGRQGAAGFRRLDAERGHIMRLLTICLERAAWAEAKRLAWALDDYLDIGSYPTERLQVTQAALTATRELGHRRDEGMFLQKIGTSYRDLGQVRQAISYYEQALQIDREIKNRQSEGIVLGNLGNAYRDLGEVRRAIEYYEQALVIARDIGDQRNEGVWLDSLGNAYSDLGEVRRGIEYYEQALAIARDIGNRQGEGRHLGNLGLSYSELGEIQQGIEYYEQALVIDREVGYRRGEGIRLFNLGKAYRDLGEVRRAIEYYEQALTIDRDIGNRQGEGADLGNLGVAYLNLGEVRRGIEYYKQALAIARDIGDRKSEGRHLGNLGNAYRNLGEVRRAIEYYEQALAIARDIGDRRNEGAWLGNLGLAYRDLGEVRWAIEYCEQALAIARDIGARYFEATWLYYLGELYKDQGNIPLARQCLEQSLAIFEAIQSPRAESARKLLAGLPGG